MLTVPSTDPRWAKIADIADLPPYLLDEIAHFFEVYKALEPGNGTEVSHWQGRSDGEHRSPGPLQAHRLSSPVARGQ